MRLKGTKKSTTCLKKPGRVNINSPEHQSESQRANGGAFGCGEWPPLIPDTARAGAC